MITGQKRKTAYETGVLQKCSMVCSLAAIPLSLNGLISSSLRAWASNRNCAAISDHPLGLHVDAAFVVWRRHGNCDQWSFFLAGGGNPWSKNVGFWRSKERMRPEISPVVSFTASEFLVESPTPNPPTYPTFCHTLIWRMEDTPKITGDGCCDRTARSSKRNGPKNPWASGCRWFVVYRLRFLQTESSQNWFRETIPDSLAGNERNPWLPAKVPLKQSSKIWTSIGGLLFAGSHFFPIGCGQYVEFWTSFGVMW